MYQSLGEENDRPALIYILLLVNLVEWLRLVKQEFNQIREKRIAYLSIVWNWLDIPALTLNFFIQYQALLVTLEEERG